MDLYVLSNRLSLASIKRENLPYYTHHLLQFIFFPEKSNRFVSLTETEDEISLILDQEYLQDLLDQNSKFIEVAASTWRALQLIVGTAGQTASGIVSSMARPLADRGISIFQLSTYEADNVIVEEHKLQDALDALKSAFSLNIIHDDEEDDDDTNEDTDDNVEDEEQNDEHVVPPKASTRNAPTVYSDSPGNTSSEQLTKRHHPFTVTTHRIYLASIDKYNLERVAPILLRLLFYVKSDRFFSVTRHGDAMSIFLDGDSFNQFPEDALNAYRETWTVIRVADGPLGFEECGIVADFASTLADAKVSIFYLSTFLTDFILVGSKDLKTATAALTKRFDLMSC